MNKIKIFDTTLRDGEQSPGCSMTILEKIEVAKKLDEMKVDIIEAGFAASNENDFEAIKRISKIVTYSSIASLARCNKKDIDLAWDAVKNAKIPRLHIFISTSDEHIFDKLNKTREEVLEITKEMVSYAKSKCPDIEFSLEDATRTDWNYACEVIDVAIKNGATTINIPDTVGYVEPQEFQDYINYLKNNSMLNQVDISVHCHNDLGNATANTMIAIKTGVNQVECTINGIGERAGNAALEEIVANIDTRRDYYDCETGVDLSKIAEVSRLVCEVTGSIIQNNKPIVGKNAFRHEAGIHQAGVLKNRHTYEIMEPTKYGIDTDNIVIGIHSGRNAFIDKIEKMNKDPNDYDIDSIKEAVKTWFGENKDKDNFSDEIFFEITEKNKLLVKKKIYK